jgi:hypothetical protein
MQVTIPFPLADALVILPPFFALNSGIVCGAVIAESLPQDLISLKVI